VLTKCHGAEASSGVDEEAESIELILNPHLDLLVVRERRSVIKVVVEVTEGGKEGALLDLDLVEVLLLERLLVKLPLRLVLAGGILALALAPTEWWSHLSTYSLPFILGSLAMKWSGSP
jgi:hypothetical protein